MIDGYRETSQSFFKVLTSPNVIRSAASGKLIYLTNEELENRKIRLKELWDKTYPDK